MEHREHNAEQRAHIGYVGPLTQSNPTADLNAALDQLAPNASTRRIVRELFANHVTHAAVAGWRNGRHKPPAWVREVLIAHLFASAKKQQELAARLRELPTFDPVAGAAHLSPARRAKQKAREAARASGQTESETQTDKITPGR